MTHAMGCALVIALLLACISTAMAEHPPVPGGVYAWAVPDEATQVRFHGRPVLIVEGTALVGLPMTLDPGEARLTYRQNGADQSHAFTVVDKQYTEQRLTIENQAMVDPPAETLARIRDETARQRALYAAFAPAVDLSSGFRLPVQGITSSLFGHRRILNGQARSPHSGLDIAADTGTPIHAAGAGVVTLAEDLYFNGNTVFVDHGQGLVTMYCHMSERVAKHGEWVDQGQLIGRVGATGRVTGPHLHWSVSLNGYRVDPATFMALLNQTVGAAPEVPVSAPSSG